LARLAACLSTDALGAIDVRHMQQSWEVHVLTPTIWSFHRGMTRTTSAISRTSRLRPGGGWWRAAS